jgi:hypothetical protein
MAWADFQGRAVDFYQSVTFSEERQIFESLKKEDRSNPELFQFLFAKVDCEKVRLTLANFLL